MGAVHGRGRALALSIEASPEESGRQQAAAPGYRAMRWRAAVMPPSIVSTLPVTNSAAGEAR